jgi:hypothetical protein
MYNEFSMRTNNLNIKQRKPSTQPHLRSLLHALKLGECFYTRDKSVIRLAGSLSRRTNWRLELACASTHCLMTASWCNVFDIDAQIS